MRKRLWIWPALAAVLVAVFVTACSVPVPQRAEMAAAAVPGAEQQAAAPAGPTLGAQRSGEVQVWLSSKPAQPVRGVAEMDAYVVEAGGQPVTNARVTFDTDMTNMSHGSYLVTAQPVGDGHYTGEVRFSMPGPWRIIAIVERPGQETARMRFEFTVKPR